MVSATPVSEEPPTAGRQPFAAAGTAERVLSAWGRRPPCDGRKDDQRRLFARARGCPWSSIQVHAPAAPGCRPRNGKRFRACAMHGWPGQSAKRSTAFWLAPGLGVASFSLGVSGSGWIELSCDLSQTVDNRRALVFRKLAKRLGHSPAVPQRVGLAKHFPQVGMRRSMCWRD